MAVAQASFIGTSRRIERRGLLRRETTQRDRRAVMVALTPRGQEITEAFYAEVSDSLQRVVAHLPADDRRRFEDVAFSILASEHVPAIFGDSEIPAPAATRPESQ